MRAGMPAARSASTKKMDRPVQLALRAAITCQRQCTCKPGLATFLKLMGHGVQNAIVAPHNPCVCVFAQ